jgi:hypothetical protein
VYALFVRKPNLEPLQMSLSWVELLEHGTRRATSRGFLDGILETIFNVIGTENKFFVELGFGCVGNAQRASAVESAHANSPTNTFNLWKQGRRTSLFDSEVEHPGVDLYKETITGESVGRIFAAPDVPVSLDYMSLDIDSVDFWMFRGLLGVDLPYRPRVFSLDYNSSFPVQSALACDPDWQPWAEYFVYGASIGAIQDLSESAGYQPVYIEEMIDLFLIRSDVIKFHGARGYTTQELAAKWSLPKPMHSRNCDRVNMIRFLDVRTFRQTNWNIDQAK